MIRFVVCLLLLASTLQAEITIVPSYAKVISGLGSPRVIAGSVLFSSESKPVITNVVIVKIDSPAKFLDVTARRYAVRDGVVLIQTANVTEIETRTYLLSGIGSYSIEVIAFDPGIERKSVEIKIAEPDAPIIDDGGVLTGVAKEARSAIVLLAQGMASDMQTIANQAKAGQLKTVSEASVANNALDVTTRETFKRSMAKTMQPLLGSGQLPANSPQVFSEISKGFGSVK